MLKKNISDQRKQKTGLSPPDSSVPPPALPLLIPSARRAQAPPQLPRRIFVAAASMGGAAISSHGLSCAAPAAVPLNPRARRASAAGHRSSPQLLLRTDLPAPAALCRARSQSSSSSNVLSTGGR